MNGILTLMVVCGCVGIGAYFPCLGLLLLYLTGNFNS